MTLKSRFNSASLNCTWLLLCGVLAAPAWAQQAIVPPVVSRVEPVSPLGGGDLPRAVPGVIPPSSVVPVGPVQTQSNAVAEAVLESLRAGRQTPREAWASGALTADDLFYIFEHKVDEWGGFYWEKDLELRRALEAVWVEHGGARLETPEKLSPQLRLWLADYYGSVRDARAVPLAESILSEFKAPSETGSALAFLAVERLGWYYRDIGEADKAAQSWLRMKSYQPPTGWWVPDSMLEAARIYLYAGQEQKAQTLYQQIEQFGNGWTTGMAHYERADILIRDGEFARAQQLLHEPLGGEGAADAQVALSTLSAYAYYMSGDFERAVGASDAAVRASKELTGTSHPLQSQVNDASEVAGWIALWKETPFAVIPSKIRAVARTDQPAFETITIRSFQEIPLAISADNPKLQVKLVGSGARSQYYFEQQAALLIEPGTITASLDASITVSSSKFPAFKTRLPVHVEARP